MALPTAEIREAILGQGEISKDDIVATWGLTEDQYKELQKVLRKDNDIEMGPRKTGGFRARLKRYRKRPSETESPAVQFSGQEWQQRTAAILADLLTGDELEDLLGRKLANAIRLDRKRRTGRDVPGRKEELAQALVIKHDRDLLSNDDGRVRDAIEKALKKRGQQINNVGRWVPGKAAALAFVHAAGLPVEVAGLAVEETPPPYEYLEGRVDLRKLEDFQQEIQRSLLNRLDEVGSRAIVTLPTGAGKTRVAVDSIRDWLTTRSRQTGEKKQAVLWLAHSAELCDQAYECFRQVWQASNDVCPLLLLRLWGRFNQDLNQKQDTLQDILTQPSVLVSTPQRIVNLLESDNETLQSVYADIRNTTCLIVIDEAHRAAAPSYQKILDAFCGLNTATNVVGLTATPYRFEYLSADPQAGTRELFELFHQKLILPTKTLGNDPRATLQERGILAKPKPVTITTTTVLQAPEAESGEGYTESNIESIDRALSIRADNPTRRQTIYEFLLPICREEQNSVLYFGPSVSDAECMAFLLRQAGIPAAFISGETRDVTRRRIVGEFKKGMLRVLCNCEVLTTGFDAPRVTHVVVARPTVSQVLYEQIVGRGLRGPKFGGTTECTIIDCEDNYRSARPTLGYQEFRKVWLSPWQSTTS